MCARDVTKLEKLAAEIAEQLSKGQVDRLSRYFARGAFIARVMIELEGDSMLLRGLETGLERSASFSQVFQGISESRCSVLRIHAEGIEPCIVFRLVDEDWFSYLIVYV
jgi:hypothetical protein